jgi:hypothetical protein
MPHRPDGKPAKGRLVVFKERSTHSFSFTSHGGFAGKSVPLYILAPLPPPLETLLRREPIIERPGLLLVEEFILINEQ